jgi:hypothetical protein
VLATFASLAATLSATFARDITQPWAFALFCAALAALAASVGWAVRALIPVEYESIGIDYLDRFPTWSQILRAPERVRGDTMRALINVVAVERARNDAKTSQVRAAFVLLLAGLGLIAAEAATLAASQAL